MQSTLNLLILLWVPNKTSNILNILPFAMAKTFEEKQNKIQITQAMLDNLDYDAGTENKHTMLQSVAKEPVGMFVFHQSDLEAAAYYLAKSLEDPLNQAAIKCAFVQESCVERFSEKLKSKLKPYSKDALKNTALSNALTKSTDIVSKLNAKTICPDTKEGYVPIVVYDFPQEHFTSDGLSPIVTLYTFRTVKEAIALSKKESFIKNATIWSENHAIAYEVIASTSLNDYYLNCSSVAWTPIQEYITKKQSFVVIDKSYHYETLVASGVQKNVVFPFGSSFAN